MFQDIVVRVQNKISEEENRINRAIEVQKLLKETVEASLPEIEKLGFTKVTYEVSRSGYFQLSISVHAGYYGLTRGYSYNLMLDTNRPRINYGFGADNSRNDESSIPFDESWNNSKIVGAMKNALRANVSKALQASEKVKLRERVQ